MKRKITALMMAALLAAGSMGTTALAEAGGDMEMTAATKEVPEEAVSAAENPEEETGAMPELTKGRIRHAESWTEIHKALLEARNRYDYYDDYLIYDGDLVYEESATADAYSAAPAEKGASENEAVPDYSGTNVRTEGVDEADVIKTDGRYLFILRNDGAELVIVEADGGELTERGKIVVRDDAPDSVKAYEFFVNGPLLHVICQEYPEDSMTPAVRVITYDVSDAGAPKMTGSLLQDGYYKEARLTGGKLYIMSEWRPILEEEESDSFLSVQAGGKELQPELFCIPEIVTDPNYLIMASVDPEKPSDLLDCRVLVSGAQQFYAGTEGLYAVNTDSSTWREKSEIVKFTYQDGMIGERAACTVRGTVNDTWSIDEYGGCTRVLTTYMGTTKGAVLEAIAGLFGLEYYPEDRWVRHNALYILDADLNLTGSLTGIAEHEDIKSARFMGDIVYFVTFLNTDPLFAADVSDPANPRLIGELKLPGFSAYLHPMENDTLVGLGYDADEQYGVTEGLKISVFDRSDPVNIRETGRVLIPGITSCPAFENYKAVFASAAEGLIGFACENHYLLYRIPADGDPERVLLYDFFEDNFQDPVYTEVRGVRIGRWFYVAGESFVTAFDMDGDFEKGDALRLF